MSKRAKAAEEEQNALPDPLEHEIFSGHKEAEQEARTALCSARLHHAWLICGPVGIGKATLAARMARFILKTGGDEALAPNPNSLAIGEDDPIFRQIATQTHPDFLLCRAESSGRSRPIIPVDEIRQVRDFFTRSAGMGGFRVCMIDAADQMNVNAANALLKVLEEPPERCLILLPAHRPGLVPATIRSRCRKLQLSTLPDEEVGALLTRHCPDLSPAEREMCILLGAGSPGRALGFAFTDKGALYRQTEEVIRSLAGGVDAETLHLLSERAGASLESWDMFLDSYGAWLSGAAEGAEGNSPAIACILRLYDLFVEVRRDTARFNLNRTHSALSLLLAAQEEAGTGA